MGFKIIVLLYYTQNSSIVFIEKLEEFFLQK